MAVSIVLLVLFVLFMALWGLEIFGKADSWKGALLAWLSMLILGVVVFLAGFGVLTYRPGP